MDIIKYAYNFSYQYTSQKTNSNYTLNLKSNNQSNEDLKIEKRIKLFIKYFDILSLSTKKDVINKIKNFSYDHLNFDKELQHLISTIDETFNWNLMITLINDIKYKNFILFIESLYSQCIFIRINNQI
jgi:hypothetical protein